MSDVEIEEDGIYTSTDVPCEHGVWHRLRVRPSSSDDWLGSIAAYQEGGDGYVALVGVPIVYSATKTAALAEGLRRLESGGCGCLAGAFYQSTSKVN